MSDSDPPSFPNSPKGEPKKSVIDILASIVGGIGAFVRKAPIFVVFAALAVILYFQQSDQPEEQVPQFEDPTCIKGNGVGVELCPSYGYTTVEWFVG
jgi:hypothetical protein